MQRDPERVMTGGLSGWLCQESSRIINNILVLQSVRHEDKLERFSIIILFNLHACENFVPLPREQKELNSCMKTVTRS